MKVKKLIILMGLYSLYSQVFANPVLSGTAVNATVQQTPGLTTVNQTAQKAILNWQSFNIHQNEATHFNQPSGGIALNRISPNAGVSQIYGKLTATGRIILINPAGIYFGPTAAVSVGGIIATTSNLSDQNFLNDKYQFEDNSGLNGTVRNDGKIVATNHGLVALVGSNVVNNGYIQANLGTVILGSAQNYTVDFAGDGLVNFTINKGVEKSSSIENNGTIIADGGRVLVSAKAASGVVDQSINMRGIVQAQSVYQKNGEIIFSGDPNAGTVNVAAKINASGKNYAQKGGKVKITGKKILVDSSTTIDVSGDQGGGSIIIGKDGTQLASSTTIKSGVLLDASTLYGQGGFIETSADYLALQNVVVNTSSRYGQTGTWLLDPTDLMIMNNGGNNVNVSPLPTSAGNSDQTISIIDVGNLQASLVNNNVVIQTFSGGIGGGSGDITVVDPVTWSSTNSLLLQAYHKIFLNADITALNGTLTLNAANIAESISSGSSASPSFYGVTANINVANFNIQQGQWYQTDGFQPTFQVSNNFSINPTGAQFLRAAGGDGALFPYVLTDIYGVQGIGYSPTLMSSNFVLGNDIDASVTANWNSGSGFIPLGQPETIGFTGTFDGANYTISNLFVSTNSTSAGLFGELDGTVSDLGVTGSVTNTSLFALPPNEVDGAAGLLAGESGNFGAASISNVHTSGSVSGINSGGIVGIARAPTTMDQSYSTANVFAETFAGGLAGVNEGAITTSYAAGTITASTFNTGMAGGLVGQLAGSGSITNAYATGTVLGYYVGGIVGQMTDASSVDFTYNTSLPLANTATPGGIVSFFNSGTVGPNNFYNNETTFTSGGLGTGYSTAQLMNISTYAGWSIDSSPNASVTWNIVNGQSFPYFSYLSPTTQPRIFTGTVPSSNGYPTTYTLLAGGNVIATMSSINNYMYFAIPTASLADNGVYVIYVTDESLVLNPNPISTTLVATAPTGGVGGTITLPGIDNTVQIGDSSTATIAVGDIITALGSTSSPDLLLSGSGSTLTIGNATHPDVDLSTTANTTLSLATNTINTTSSSTTGDMTFDGPVTITGASTINSGSGNQNYNNTFSVNASGLPVSLTGNTITFPNSILGVANLSITANNTTLDGTLPPGFLGNYQFIGAGANNTLTINSTGTLDWLILNANAGSFSGTNVNFSNMQNLAGGAQNDNFIIDTNGTLSGTINGGAGTNSITGNSAITNNWNITGTDSGTLTNVAGFSNIANLIGGSNDDNFTFESGASLTGSVSGGTGGSNSLSFNLANAGILWTLNGSNDAGIISNIPGASNLSFSGMSSLIGSGTDTLVGPNANTTWTITGANSGFIPGTGFSGMANLTGGTAGNAFIISSAGSLSGTIDGGSAAGNSLRAPDNTTNNWNITGTNAGNITGLLGGFTNLQSLIGGSDAYDTFVFTSSGQITGNIDGGNDTGFLFLPFNSITTASGATISTAFNITGSWAGTIAITDSSGPTTTTTSFSNIQMLNGAGSNNTFTAPTNTNIFTLNGTNSGNVQVGPSPIISAFVSFSGVNTINGGGGTDTLRATNVANVWTIDGSNQGSIGGLNFTSMENVTGGTDTDSFTLAGGTLTGTINGGTGSGVNTLIGDSTTISNAWDITGFNSGTLNGGAFSNIQNITGGSNDDTFTFTSFINGALDGGGGSNTLINSITNTTWSMSSLTSGSTSFIFGSGFSNINTIVGAGSDALVAPNSLNTWTMTGDNAGTLQSGLTTLTFSGMSNWVGGSSDDAFTLNAANSVGGIDGGGGNNSLSAANIANTWNIDGSDQGSITNINTTTNYSNIGSLIGSAANDDFILAGGTLSGSINGGGGTNSLTGNDTTNAWGITGSNSGTLADITGGFSNINNIIGGTGADTFTLTVSSFSGTLDGGTGLNTLIGANAVNSWSISGGNSGTLNSGGFSNIQNVTGGSDDDTFTFTSSLSGALDGGLGTNTLINNSGNATWTLNSLTSGATSFILGGFSNINNIFGSGSDSLTAPNAINTWTLTGNNAGNLLSGLSTLAFTGMSSWIGGSSDDAFTLDPNFTIASVNGGGGNNSLTAGNVANSWSITGTNQGSVTGSSNTNFSSIGTLIGGSNNDLFTLAGGTLSGSINGGGGTNSLTGNDATNNWGISGSNSGTLADITGGFSNINNIIGGTGADTFTLTVSSFSGTLNGGAGINTLVGANAVNSWSISGGNSGTLNGGGFSNIQNVTGGSDDDTFTFTSSLSGALDGGSGTNTLINNSGNATWALNSLTSGTTSFLGNGFSNINNIVGSGSDSLTATNTSNIWTLTGNNAGNLQSGITTLAFSGMSSWIGGSSDDSFTLDPNFTLANINGGGGNNSLTAGNVANSWSITGTNQGSVTGSSNTNFSSIGTLIGGSNNDLFTLAGGTLSGTIDGMGGINSLTASIGTNNWNFTGSNSGTVTSVPNGFTNINHVIGGGGNDNFNLGGTTFAGSITGGGGSDSLTANNGTNAWNITGNNSGTVTDLTGGFSNIGTLIGGSGDDTFTLSGGSLSGVISGGGGNNSLIASAFNITGPNSGSGPGIGGFNSIQNLSGSSFTFAGGSLSGDLTGTGGNNTISTTTGNNSFTLSGTGTGNMTGLGGVFSNIQNIVASDNTVFLNTLDFSPYANAITVQLVGSIVDGYAVDSSATNIINFGNFNNIVANPNFVNYLNLPVNKFTTVVITGTIGPVGDVVGYIGDPTFFSGFFNNFPITPTQIAAINNNNNIFNPEISQIIQQSLIEFDVPNYYDDSVEKNINSIISNIQIEYRDKLYKFSINPYCGSSSDGESETE